MNNYYKIITKTKSGDAENYLVHVGQSSMEPKACQAEVAQSVNRGTFDNELYAEPCFDVDGYVSAPYAIDVIDEQTYEVLALHLEVFDFSKSEKELSEDILECIKHL